jgi:tripartite-type tricarboxylate transporter receptor subunit TctC
VACVQHGPLAWCHFLEILPVASIRGERGEHDETFAPSICASGRGRSRASGRLALRLGASLSVSAGAPHRTFSSSWRLCIVARLIGQSLSERLGQPFIIENRPGAGSNIGTEAVVRAAPDGYTLLLAGINNTINATFHDKLNFNFIRDITPVAAIDGVPTIMVVHPSFPAKTIPEFIAYAGANRGKIAFASEGIGGVGHLCGELFKIMGGVNMVHVPYRGVAPALTDLMGAQMQVMFVSMSSSIEYVRAGKLRALAVTAATRSEALPEIPTVGEFLPGFEVTAWHASARPRIPPAAPSMSSTGR